MTGFDPSTDLIDLKGKVAFVTGGSGGIGLETVRLLARAGALVYMGARSESRAVGAIAELEREGLAPGNGEIQYFNLDLSDPRDVKKAGEAFLARKTRLDLLIHNAGIMTKNAKGKDGVADMVTVNYMGPFLLTRTLLPLLQDTAKKPKSDVRIIYVSSIGHLCTWPPIKFERVQDFNLKFSWPLFLFYFFQYAYSKFMGILWTKTLQRRLSEDASAPITVISLHPGIVNTPVLTSDFLFPRFFRFLLSLWSLSVPEGAHTTVFAAASKQVAQHRKAYEGAYLSCSPVGVIARPHAETLDISKGEDLWKLTEDYLASLGL